MPNIKMAVSTFSVTQLLRLVVLIKVTTQQIKNMTKYTLSKWFSLKVFLSGVIAVEKVIQKYLEKWYKIKKQGYNK